MLSKTLTEKMIEGQLRKYVNGEKVLDTDFASKTIKTPKDLSREDLKEIIDNCCFPSTRVPVDPENKHSTPSWAILHAWSINDSSGQELYVFIADDADAEEEPSWYLCISNTPPDNWFCDCY